MSSNEGEEDLLAADAERRVSMCTGIGIKRERLLLELKDCDNSQGSCEIMMGHICGGFDESDNDSDDMQADVNRVEGDIIANPCEKTYNIVNDDRVIDLDDLKFKKLNLSTYFLVPDGQ